MSRAIFRSVPPATTLIGGEEILAGSAGSDTHVNPATGAALLLHLPASQL